MEVLFHLGALMVWLTNTLDAVKQAGSWLAAKISNYGQLLSFAIAIIAVGYVFVQMHWSSDGGNIENVGRSWSESIARLGIRPLFPPAEDFHVGDIYAVLRSTSDSTGASPVSDGRLASRSIRVGRVDMREMILARQRQRLTLQVASTLTSDGIEPKMAEDNASIRSYQVTVQGGDAIRLSRLLFPGITISVSKALGTGALLDWISSRSRRSRSEEIVIDHPLTYGVDAEAALAQLNVFCGVPKLTNIRCDEDYLRYVLATQFGEEVCETRDGKRVYGIDLMLVNRVFVSRRIAVVQRASFDGEIGRGLVKEEDAAEVDNREALAAPARKDAPPPAAAPAEGGVRMRRANEIRSSDLLPRPLTFGFHGVSLATTKVGSREFKCEQS